MSEIIDVDCPFACPGHYEGIRCTLDKGGICHIMLYNGKSHEYEPNAYVSCVIKDTAISWIDERIKKSKCAICQACDQEEL